MAGLKVFGKAQGKCIESFPVLGKVRGLEKKSTRREWDIERQMPRCGCMT
jgi:hypothetical protein